MTIDPSIYAVGTQPLVSAIVSAYNSERFIRGCLEDLEAQTIADRLEIVVIESGSPQNEGAIVREFQQRFDNIVYIRTAQRESLYTAWNRGIQAARGIYLTNANTDDRHKRDAFEHMVTTLETRPDIALVYANVYFTRTENETFENHTPVGQLNYPDFDPIELLRRNYIGPQPMWRKQLHTRYGYFDESFEVSGDWDFWLRMAENETFLHLRAFLGLYLSAPAGIENRNPKLLFQEDLRIYQRYGHRTDPSAKAGIDSGATITNPTNIKTDKLYNHAAPSRPETTARRWAAQISQPPPVSCICLTYGRPELLEEAIYSFLQQDYIGAKELIILNDYDQQRLEFEHPEVRVINLPQRVRTVGEKRNLAVALASHDLLFVWDDDDICLPHRLSLSVARFESAKGYFKASNTWFWNNDQLSGPHRNGFHCTSCWSRELFNAVRGYEAAGSGEDRVFEQRLKHRFLGSTHADNLRPEENYYIYRWDGTGSYHMSAYGAYHPGSNIGHHQVEAFVRQQAHRGEIRQGRITLQPHWRTDYQQLVSNYIATLAAEQVPGRY